MKPKKVIARMSFEEAKSKYVNRYTMQHIPAWALKQAPNGKWYAPHYRSDKEWYDLSIFPPHNPLHNSDCFSGNQTWPLGQWLEESINKVCL